MASVQTSRIARRIAELEQAERDLHLRIRELDGDALALEPWQHGAYQRITDRANELERICLKHAAERQRLERLLEPVEA